MQAFNHDDYIDYRLMMWAFWYETLYKGLDLPSRSVEGRLMDDGGILPSGTRQAREMPENPEAEEVDRFINQLEKSHSVLGKVIRKYYTSNNVSEEAKALGMSRRKFYYDLKTAKAWLAAKIEC